MSVVEENGKLSYKPLLTDKNIITEDFLGIILYLFCIYFVFVCYLSCWTGRVKQEAWNQVKDRKASPDHKSRIRNGLRQSYVTMALEKSFHFSIPQIRVHWWDESEENHWDQRREIGKWKLIGSKEVVVRWLSSVPTRTLSTSHFFKDVEINTARS